MNTSELDNVLRYMRTHIYEDNDEAFQHDRRRLLYALTWPAAWLDSQALRMDAQDYRRMLMEKLEQIHAHGDPARYRTYFPRYLLKCLQDHCHHHHETLYRELKHASYGIEHILESLQNSRPEHTTVLAQAHALLAEPEPSQQGHHCANQTNDTGPVSVIIPKQPGLPFGSPNPFPKTAHTSKSYDATG